ncbi:MAG: HAMP domain-containing histidine kinase [Planctomycetes bacterium]|nr:HAMP domain-containing histidine kinase [Planctomycetota bacterium]
MRAPAVLELVPVADRFTVADGSVVIPPSIGWLRQDAGPAQDAVVAERLRQAQIAEFVRADAAEAARQFDELLGPQGPRGDAALPVVLAAAWQAQRAGDTARCDTLLAQLDTALARWSPGDLRQAQNCELLAGAALLAAARGRSPEWLPALVPALPWTLAEPVCDRLAERYQPAASLRACAQQLTNQREQLALAQSAGPFAESAFARAEHGQLLLWFPDPEHRGSGAGALTAPTNLRSLVGLGTRLATTNTNLPPIPDVPGLSFERPRGDHETVLEGLVWVAPAPVPAPPWFASPSAVLSATLVLVAVFAGSLWFALRAVRRESLAMRARSEFLTGVTHELKTPIASIRLVAEVLTEDQVTPAKQREYFGLLAGESARLSMLIENVLDLGQMERGERAYDLRPGDLAEVARDAAKLFAPLASQVGMQLLLHEGTERAAAIVDRGALQQALLAVLENARKYARDGGVLELSTRTEGADFTLEVRDHGPGVPAHENEGIFTRFQRGEAHRHGSIPGTGLGLYLARTIVQRHGGSLVCRTPANGPGACFRFTLPLSREDHA